MVLIKKLKPSVVISRGIYCNLVSSIVKMCFGDKVKTVVSEHNTPSIHFKLRGRFWGFVLKQVIKNFYHRNDLVIAVSKGILEELLQISPKINTKKADVLYNMVNINEIKEMAKEEVSGLEVPHREGMVITSVGRLVPQKDYSTLLHAFKLVSEKYRATLLIVGDGQEKERLIQLSENLRLKDSVVFLGYQRNPYKYINLSDIFVLSSIWESFGIVIVEALSLGKPVVATDCPYGPREILDNGTFGLLVKVGDHSNLAEQMIKLMSSPDLYAKLSELSMRRAYDFSSKDKIDKFIAMLDRI